MTRFVRRLRYWLQPGKMDSELAEELDFHRAMLAGSGQAPAVMGNTTLAREDARRVWIWPWLESFGQDIRYALRTMRRDPGFTLVALLALGSAIGLNTSLFTIFNAVALRPWPVADPSRVVRVHRFTREGGGDFGIAEARYFAQYSRAFSGLISMRNGERVQLGDTRLELTYVSGGYFHVLGVQMERGRGFLDQEDRTGAPGAVAVISHDLWENRFGGDPQIVGRVIRLDDIPFTVVGVAPAEFTGTNPLRNDVWTTLAAKKLLRPNDPSVEHWLTAANYCCTSLAGRLAPGITRAQAENELEMLAERFRTANGLGGERARIAVAGTAWIDTPRKKAQAVASIVTLFLAVTLVLLLACANVGNLLLARAAARRREISVRLSLGGSRSRLIRQLLVESMLLAFGAAAFGLAMALVVPAAVIRRLAEDQNFHVAPDRSVLLYTMAVAVLSCLAFGLAPALHGTRAGIAAVLKAGEGAEGARFRRIPLRSLLLAVQVAISVILLANAGLLVRGMQRAQTLNPGFDVAHVTVVSIELPATEYSGPRAKELTRALEAQLESSPGLPACGLALNPPLSNSNWSTSFRARSGSQKGIIYMNEISGRYADAVGMRLVAGRNFVPDDSSRDVLAINEAAARRWWPGENPLGKMVLANERMRQIVGVVSDTYTNDLSSVEAVIYFPITGSLGVPFVLVHDSSAASLERVATVVKQLEPRAQVRSEPLQAGFRRRLQPAVYGSEVAGMLGLLALAITAVGMFGVFSYVVGQRTREIGVRMALGATPRQIVRLMLASSAGAFAGGVVCGIAGAAGISALLAHGIPGIRPADPIAYLGVLLLLAAAGAVASIVPSRRATRVDPVRALRWE